MFEGRQHSDGSLTLKMVSVILHRSLFHTQGSILTPLTTDSYALPSIFKNNLLVCSTVSTIEFSLRSREKQTCSINVSVLSVSVHTSKERDTEWCEVQFATSAQRIPMIRRGARDGSYLIYGQWTFSTDGSYQTVDGILVQTSRASFLVDRKRRRFGHRPFCRFPALIVHSTDQNLSRGNRYRVMMVSATN